MPELPEVETIRRELHHVLTGKKITGCFIVRPDIIGYPSPAAFCRGLTGRRIMKVDRRAKYLILRLDGGLSLIFHLRLSGALIYTKSQTDKIKYGRLVLRLGSNNLIFSEPRVLGRAYLIESDNIPSCLQGFNRLGQEPLVRKFNVNYLRDRIIHRQAPIKNLMLDQSICAGTGNIYADEALFRAGIKPDRRANTLNHAEIVRLVKKLKEVLRAGIKNGGTTVSDYRRIDGRTGGFQRSLNVYGRENKPCLVCGTAIVYIKIGNRGTRYCPSCQK